MHVVGGWPLLEPAWMFCNVGDLNGNNMKIIMLDAIRLLTEFYSSNLQLPSGVTPASCGLRN